MIFIAGEIDPNATPEERHSYGGAMVTLASDLTCASLYETKCPHVMGGGIDGLIASAMALELGVQGVRPRNMEPNGGKMYVEKVREFLSNLVRNEVDTVPVDRSGKDFDVTNN